MPRGPLLVLTVLALGGVLAVPETHTPAAQLLPQDSLGTTARPAASESHTPSATTPGPLATRAYSSPSPRRGPRITLSLDVPLGLLHILLEQARARAAREQAVANAHVLAHAGR
ncbi:urocortin-2 [Tupaia chinensis]|uniref:Urocortin-2 n=1 Tax=Tupaia chinensis TaxID=246437 RepID=L8Y3Z1_TUPCH|nr:urocortin-2 [Tupaia chinensis]ELV09665.1 Urocortin-2 [Tupaia chinensis]